MANFAKPTDYDRSFEWLNKKRESPYKMSNPGLDARADFGSATKNELSGSSANKIGKVGGTTSWQTPRPDNPLGMDLPLGQTPSDFQSKQIPNTAPKYTHGIHTKVDTSTITNSGKSMVFHGDPVTKKGL